MTAALAAALVTSLGAPTAEAASLGVVYVQGSGIVADTPTFITSGACPAGDQVRVKVFGGSGAGATIPAPLTINSPKNILGTAAANGFLNSDGTTMSIPSTSTWFDFASTGTPVLATLNGTYTVRAWCTTGDWFDGSVTFTGASLDVATYVSTKTAPTAPQGVTAAATGSGTATVTWTGPVTDGGSAVTSYTVTPSGAGSCSVTALSAACSGLVASTGYTFSVSATNTTGAGPARVSNSVTTQSAGVAPTAPTSVVAVAGDAAATVSWGVPASDGGSPITAYTVTSIPSGGVCAVSGTTAACTGLTNGTSYTFSVTAKNVVGTGPAAVSNAVIPKGVVTATVVVAGKTYDGTTAATISSCSLTPAPSGVSCSTAAATAVFSDGNAAAGKPVAVTGLALTGASAGGFSLASTSASATATISKAASTTTVSCPASAAFTGVAVTPCTASATGVGGLNQSITPTYSNNVNVGTAAASATFAGDTNHNGSTGSATFGITGSSVSATVTVADKTYDGTTAASITSCTLTPVVAGLSCNVAGATATFDTAAAAPGKTVTVTGLAVAGAQAGNFSLTSTSVATTAAITKATTSTTISCPASVIVTGAAVEPCTASVTGVGLSGVTVTPTYANNVNVGTATVNASYPGDANHAGSTATPVTFAIIDGTLPSVTASVSVADKGYDGTTSATITSCTLSPAVSGVTCDSSASSATFASADAGAGKAVTVTGLALTGPAAGTVALASTSASTTATISKATTATVVICPVSVTFTGAALEPCTAGVAGTDGLSSTVPVVYGTNVGVGTATADASYAGDVNHASSVATQVTFQIVTAGLTAVVVVADKTYDGTTSATITSCSLSPATVGVTCDSSGASAVFTTSTAGAGKAVNVSGLALSGPSSGSFSLASTATTTASITKADSVTSLSCPASVTFTGSTVTPCTASVAGAGGLNQPVTPTYAGNTAVGTATANATFAGDANHNGSSAAPTTFEITATVPGAPGTVAATAGDASASVSWSAPTSDGGSPITGYTVTAAPAAGTCIVTGTTAACTGLANGTPYTFSVVAANVVGSGPAGISPQVTPAAAGQGVAPAAPVRVRAEARDRSIEVSWSPGQARRAATDSGRSRDAGSAGDPAARVVSFTATAMPGGASCTVTVGSKLKERYSCVIRGLVGGTAYRFTVTATSVSGGTSTSAEVGPIRLKDRPGDCRWDGSFWDRLLAVLS